jgi:hypothetical protein
MKTGETIEFLDRIPKTSQIGVGDKSRARWAPHDGTRPIGRWRSQGIDGETHDGVA